MHAAAQLPCASRESQLQSCEYREKEEVRKWKRRDRQTVRVEKERKRSSKR